MKSSCPASRLRGPLVSSAEGRVGHVGVDKGPDPYVVEYIARPSVPTRFPVNTIPTPTRVEGDIPGGESGIRGIPLNTPRVSRPTLGTPVGDTDSCVESEGPVFYGPVDARYLNSGGSSEKELG